MTEVEFLHEMKNIGCLQKSMVDMSKRIVEKTSRLLETAYIYLPKDTKEKIE